MAAALLVRDAPGGVRVLEVSNPQRRNALDDGLFEQLSAALADAAGVRAFLVRGAGDDAFSAGYDVTGLAPPAPSDRLPDERLGEVLDALSRHPAPSVALVTGPAYGAGCELACACDFRVGDARAAFCMPPARLGVVYSLAGLGRVAARAGEGTARYLFLTARRVGADEALRRGLLDVLAAPGQAEAEALALCAEVAALAPRALAGMKQGFELLRRGATASDEARYLTLRREAFTSADAREGLAAFREKRPPAFRGE